MERIKPGTLCLVVQTGNVLPEYVGASVTVVLYLGACTCGLPHCTGADQYAVAMSRSGAHFLATRPALKPILPPGIDTGEDTATDRPVTAPGVSA